MGRIVHYVDDNGEEFPAIIRQVVAGTADFVHLTLFDGDGAIPCARVPYDGSGQPERNTWHWPERS